MIVFYMRSSSYTGFTFCNFKYFLLYSLGFPDSSHNNKAAKGNILHKGLELLARHKLAKQNNEVSFSEGEIGKTWQCDTFNEHIAIEEAWDYYTKIRNPEHEWKALDFKHCKKWMIDTLEDNDGMFSAMKRTVIQPEQYFDFEIEEDWAKYEYEVQGKKLVGRLRMKGTVDLVCAVDETPYVIEYIDYKSGDRRDWNSMSNKKKGYDDFREDPQLRIYHYALCHLYPNVKTIIMTIYWNRDGRAFSIPFDRSDIIKTKEMIRKRFETIKESTHPKRIAPSHRCGWCHYSRHNQIVDGKDTGVSICDYMHKELHSIGMEKMTEKYADLSKVANYQEGGGRAAKEVSE